jgi:hypothetical protein
MTEIADCLKKELCVLQLLYLRMHNIGKLTGQLLILTLTVDLSFLLFLLPTSQPFVPPKREA